MRSTKLIMITNDDGIDAPGLRTACEAVHDLGDTWVVGPKHEYSSCSHSVTLLKPIFCTKLAPRRYAIEGTPADTVFVAFSDILPRLPDLVVSGVNAGPNLGKDAFYSGSPRRGRRRSGAFRPSPYRCRETDGWRRPGGSSGCSRAPSSPGGAGRRP